LRADPFRLATLFGLSPRMRVDLIINQFFFEGIQKRKIIIYQKSYNRSSVRIRDIAKAIIMALEADERLVRNQVFNVGSQSGNYIKEEIIRLVQKPVPGVAIEYMDLTFGKGMRAIRVSFDKIERVLGYKADVSVEDCIQESCDAILWNSCSIRRRSAIETPSSSSNRPSRT
jgi:nucleoside-diphosphate-sugar epimerase